MKNTESIYRKGSIHLCRFSFTNLRQGKIRPVAVLSEEETYDDVIVMAISSVTDRRPSSSAILLPSHHKEFIKTGLKRDSCLLAHRIVTLQKERLFCRLGQLPQEFIDRIDEQLLDQFHVGQDFESHPPMIPYGRQSINSRDVFSVVKTLRSDWLTQGPKVPAFEQAVADYCGARHAVAVNSATSALHIACLALGLGPGDWLWTTPITFAASANCGLYCGARVDLVDIDPRTYNMSIPALETKLALAEQKGVLPKVLIPVHMCGQPCDMRAIHDLAQRYGFRIIEDASHAIGGRYQNEPIGNCRFSDITVFSFHPVKIITTGEGGTALTNSSQSAMKMELLRSHGITRNPALFVEDRNQKSDHSPPSYYYEQIDLGFNYRMTDIQAALGLSQLQRLDSFVARRRELAKRYGELLAGLPVVTPWQHPDGVSAWHLYVIRLTGAKAGAHLQVFNVMHELGIGVNLHYIPVHTQPHYRQQCSKLGDFPEAEKYYQEAVTLPLFATMTEDEQDNVVTVLKSVLT